MEEDHTGENRHCGGEIGKHRFPGHGQPRDGIAGEEEADHRAEQGEEQHRKQVGRLPQRLDVGRQAALAANHGQHREKHGAHPHHGIGPGKGRGPPGDAPGQKRIGCRPGHSHQQGSHADPIQGAGIFVHQTDADDAAHGKQAEQQLAAGGPFLQDRPCRQGGDHRDHGDHDAGEAGGGMEDAELLPQEVDHRLGHAQGHKGQQEALGLPQAGHLSGKQVHDQKRQQEAVTQKHEHVGRVQAGPGREKAEAPEAVAKYGGQGGAQNGTIICFHGFT